MNAADKSLDILEVDIESLDDNILEGAGATLGTGDLGSGRTNTHYPGSGQLRRWRLLTHLTMQLLSPVQHVQHDLVEHRSAQDVSTWSGPEGLHPDCDGPCTRVTFHTK